MGATLQSLLFLYWIFTTVDANVTWTDDCEEQLLIVDLEKLVKFCPSTNRTQTLAVGTFWQVLYSPRDGGTVVTKIATKLVTFMQTNSPTTTLTPHTVVDPDSQPRPCGDESLATNRYVAIDSVTGIVYAAYLYCGRIRAYDLKQKLFSSVHEDPFSSVGPIATASREGLLIWMHRFNAGSDKLSMRRALMDGTEVKVIIDRLVLPEGRYFGNLAVDEKTSLVYWTIEGKGDTEMFRCDLQGNNRLKLDLGRMDRVFSFAICDNIMFLQVGDLRSGSIGLYRADVRKPEKRLVYSGAVQDAAQMQPGRVDNLDDFIENPCENNTCSHICVQSNNHIRHTCICPDDYVLHRDGHNCGLVGRNLFVSTTMEGIWQIPILNGDATEPKVLVKRVHNVTDVQCDPMQRKIFWAEGNGQFTKILQLDMKNIEKAPEVVFKHSLIARARHEGLGAFALDFYTENLYIAFNDEPRILVCGRDNESTQYSKCAALFGYQVGFIITGLTLDLTKGTMYWVESDEEGSAVRRGGMDGSWMETLKKGGQPKSLALDAHSRVYWWNQAQKQFGYYNPENGHHGSHWYQKYNSYAHQWITIDGSSIYWVGVSNASNSSAETVFKDRFDELGHLRGRDSIERYVDIEFKNVTGLWACHADFQRTKTVRKCGNGHQCAGLCLLNGTDSFRCVCPMGFESHGTNRSSCKEIQQIPIIYSTTTEGFNRGITMKNGMKKTSIYNGSVVRMAFDPVTTELFWFNHPSREKIVPDKLSQAFRLILMKNQSQGTKTAPQSFLFQFEGVPDQLEYDWIGENLYFVNHRGIGLCSTATGECTIVSEWGRTMTLDPSNGHMYWSDPGSNGSSSGVWRGHMDGSAGTVIIPEAEATFLTVDHTSKLLFWLQYVRKSNHTKVYYSDLDGKNVRQTIRLCIHVELIRVSGGRLWMQHTGGTLSCDKETGDNVKTHKLGTQGSVTDLIIQTSAGQIQTDRDPCILGALCSHMCIPTPNGYMRCLCPIGYKLLSDGWTCECHDANICNASNPNKLPPQLRHSQTYPISKETTQVACQGKEFTCVGKCLGIDKLCNGVPDCADFSDEGEGCHKPCKYGSGCLHNCSRSPTGPRCFCPPHQMLAADNKSCVKVELIHDGKLKVGLIGAGVVGVALVIVIILGTLKYRQTKRERDLMQGELDEFMVGDPAAASVAPNGVDRALLLPFTKVILPEDIIIARDTKLGSGEFGVVHPGICHSEPVAIKVLKHSVDVEEFKAVLAEVKIMAYLGDFEFIVKFVGAEISEVSKRKIMIVTELSPKGDLLKYLWKVASIGLETPPGMYENVDGNPSGVTNLTLHSWCEQIATGMEYLAQKQIVHGDIAARNVLVFKDNVVKIADFGLSKQLYGCSTYLMKRERKLPWKWSAIELLTSREFSEASDVWAFGVTAWEIFTLGKTPYKGIMIGNEFIQYIRAGNRLPQPPHASEEIFKILLECWDPEPRNRPNFQRLKEIFHDFVDQQRGCMQPVMNTAGSTYVTAV